MNQPNLLIYGATGYTGELIARRAVQTGMHPILAGRNAAKIAALAPELDVESRVFSLDDASALDAGLRDIGMVLHCAGPFSQTAKPMADACIRHRAHYLDITGEIAVYESLARKSKAAFDAGVMLMPGVGFDVVPSDCLAAHLKRRMPNAKQLTLAWMSTGGSSRGTLRTAAQGIHLGGAVRVNGKITRVPGAWKTRAFDFGRGARAAVTIPWGDVSTAYHSTGIPNIEVYSVYPKSVVRLMIASRYIGWLLESRWAQSFMKRQIHKLPAGPNAAERLRGKSILIGQVEDNAGNQKISRLTGPEGYTLTVLTALAIARRVLAGDFKPSFQTPSLAYGADFILEIEGVQREDI